MLLTGIGVFLFSIPISFVITIVMFDYLGINWAHYGQGDLTAILAGFITVYFVYIPYCFVIKKNFKLSTPITLRWKWIFGLLTIFPIAVYFSYIYLPINYQNKGLEHAFELGFLGFAGISACASAIAYCAPSHLPVSLNQPEELDFFELKSPEPVEIPINGTLDLHIFQPREVKELVPDYLTACRKKGILEVRIIHGKGTGTLRRTVHSILEKLPEVVSFRLAGEDAGGWGATIVVLGPQETSSPKVQM